MKKRWLAVLGLACSLAVGAEPQVSRFQGAYRPGQAVPILGHYFRGQVSLTPVADLRDCQQLRMRLELSNAGQSPACLAFYLVVQDAQGNLLGADGYDESVFPRQPGWHAEHQVDLAMPLGARGSAARYQVILIEDGKRLK